MTNAVDISNLALSRLGADATVASISPPDGSNEAGWCAQFYPLARRYLLSMPWSFCTKRVVLAEVVNESQVWGYAYALPPGYLSAIRVLQPDQLSEQYSAEFEVEDGVLYTNEPDAVLKYTQDVTDTTRFSPSFVDVLTTLLASYVAGPLLRGDTGQKVGAALMELALAGAQRALAVDANSSQLVHDTFTPDGIRART